MKLELLVLFFAYLKSSLDIYEELKEAVEQKIQTKDHFLFNLEKKHHAFEAYVHDKKIVFKTWIKPTFKYKLKDQLKSDSVRYNTANEAIRKICDYYLLSDCSELQGFEVFCKLKFMGSRKDIEFNLKNFFYYGIEPDFFSMIYNSNGQKQIRELCSCFSQDNMIDFDFCFSLTKYSLKNSIQCFEEENEMKIFFPVKLRNLMFFFKIDVSNLYFVEKKYTDELIKLHSSIGKDNDSTNVCILMSKIFTFSDFVLHLNLLKDINDTEKKLSSQFLIKNCEKNFFNIAFPKK
ncbi:hypothetical protein NCER_101940 [Vairimorpha ceranae BRL01]|uniref:Uncharacterized protein n=1 Tax=Vairimorpha ceranae (strain BRL01) TaxID=578460 RepID=C4VB25_VAIC1|nr:hypothetical protein NCER_101940 [Vairimorpha ceranae BRL01]